MDSRLSNVQRYTNVVLPCACLAIAAAVGSMVALVDTRLFAICLIAFPTAIATFMLYRRYVRRELPATAIFGSWLVALASATITFNAIRVLLNATLADCLLAAGGMVLLVAFLCERYTWPAYPLVGAVGVALLGFSVAASTAISHTPDVDLHSGVLFLAGAALTPLVVAAAARSPAALKVIASLWVASGAVNGLISALDSARLTTLAPVVTGVSDLRWQQAQGLTDHPNALGLACVMVVPVGFALVLSERRFAFRMVFAALTALAVIGVLESGSRGATLGIPVGPAIAALLLPKRRAGTLAVVTVTIALTVTLGVFGGLNLISVARLTGQVSVQGSNDGRIAALAQSLNDFFGSPLIGNGYGYVRDAHDIYLQAAAAGGAIGLTGFLLLLGAIVHSGVRSTFRTDLPFRLRILAAGLVGSLVTWLAVGIVENEIYDRYLYWPAGLLLAVRFLTARVGQTESETSESVSAPEDPIARGDVGLQHTAGRLGGGG